jgi:hypothetical protein
VFDKVNAEGIYCNLHTGQEKKDLPFANHLACTVEMTYLNKQWEVAVIDEVQVIKMHFLHILQHAFCFFSFLRRTQYLELHHPIRLFKDKLVKYCTLTLPVLHDGSDDER